MLLPEYVALLTPVPIGVMWNHLHYGLFSHLLTLPQFFRWADKKCKLDSFLSMTNLSEDCTVYINLLTLKVTANYYP